MTSENLKTHKDSRRPWSLSDPASQTLQLLLLFGWQTIRQNYKNLPTVQCPVHLAPHPNHLSYWTEAGKNISLLFLSRKKLISK